MRAWMIGIGSIFLASVVWAAGGSNDRSGAEGGRRIMAQSAASGIEGQVYIRPVRSVERKGLPNQQPYQAQITVLDLAGRKVAVVDSDAKGKFLITLAPGTYVLRPESPALYPRASEQRVTVGPSSISQVEIIYDSGKR